MLPESEAQALKLESLPPLVQVQTLFPAYMSSTFMPEHGQFWDRVFEVTPTYTPDPLAFVIFRGGGKSTTAEAASVILMGQERRTFGLYVSGTQPLANKHVASVQNMLESAPIQTHYPAIGRPKIGMTGQQRAWRTGAGSKAELLCENGAALLAVGLDTAVRGLKIEERRPDFIILDEIDDRGDSPETVKKNLAALVTNVLPMRAPGCWIVFVQNMIHNYSIMTKVVRRDVKLLAKRELIGPVPAVRDCEIEESAEGRDIIVAGTASWPERMPIEESQTIIDEGTVEAFYSEYQHEVDRLAAGAIYPTWRETHHLATFDELIDLIGFDEVVNDAGEVTLADDWRMLIGLDWGTTIGHRAVTSLWATPPARLDVFGIHKMWFKVGELCRPRDEEDLADMTAEVYGELILDTWFSLAPEFAALRFDLKQVEGALMSHERRTERNTFRKYLSRQINFEAYTGGATGGIEQMRTAMRPDFTKRNLLRRYPEGWKDPKTGEDLSGQHLLGAVNIVWLVASGHGEIEIDENGKLRAKTGKGDPGMARGREEYPEYHYVKLIQSGIETSIPYNKELNDACDADRMVSDAEFPRQRSLTEQETIARAVDAAIPLPNPERARTGLEPSLAEAQHTRIVEAQRMQRASVSSHNGPRRRRGGLS